jgi:hypothetical protein
MRFLHFHQPAVAAFRCWERLRWQGPAACTEDRPALSSERAPQKNKTVTIKQY